MTIAITTLTIATIYGMLVLYAWLERTRWRERAGDCFYASMYWGLEQELAESRKDELFAERCAHQSETYAALHEDFLERSKRSVWRVW